MPKIIEIKNIWKSSCCMASLLFSVSLLHLMVKMKNRDLMVLIAVMGGVPIADQQNSVCSSYPGFFCWKQWSLWNYEVFSEHLQEMQTYQGKSISVCMWKKHSNCVAKEYTFNIYMKSRANTGLASCLSLCLNVCNYFFPAAIGVVSHLCFLGLRASLGWSEAPSHSCLRL